MKALTYIEHGKFALTEKPKPELIDSRDAIVRVTLGSICTSDLISSHSDEHSTFTHTVELRITTRLQNLPL